MDENSTVGEVVPADRLPDRLPGMGPLLTAHAKDERALRVWSAGLVVMIKRAGGEDGLLDEVTDDLLEGCSLRVVAEHRGVRVGELARFLAANEAAYRGMLMVKADLLAHETLAIADEGGVEDVAHRKLKIDTRWKLLSRWDRQTYGDEKAAVQVDTQITIIHESA